MTPIYRYPLFRNLSVRDVSKIVIAVVLLLECLAIAIGVARADSASSGGTGGGTQTVGGQYLSSPPVLTNNQFAQFLLDANGNLLIASPSLLAAISSPLTPCSAANCSAANPVGAVLIAGLAQGSTTSGQTGVMAMATTSPATTNIYNAAPLNTAAQTYSLITNPFGALHVANGTYVATTTPTVQSAHAYTPGQEVGGFINMVSGVSTGTAQGRLLSITVISRAVNTNYFDACLFYNVSIAGTYTDGSAPVAASADWNKQWKCVQLNNPNSDIGTGTIWQADNLNLGLQFTTWGVVLIDKSGTFTTSASTSDVQVVGTLAY